MGLSTDSLTTARGAGAPPPSVIRCDDAAVWDNYVRQHPSASTYHHWAWKRVIEQTFRHPTEYLVATANGVVEGVLPLVRMRSRLFGHFFVSMPFVNYGGLLATTPEAETALLSAAAERARALRVDHVELRQGARADFGWGEATAKVSMRVALPASAEKYFGALSSRLRGKVRKAQKHGFRVAWGGVEAVPGFYRVFAENMRYLGTPVMPQSWFESVLRETGEQSRILMLWEGERPVAGTVLTGYRKMLELPWIASLPDSRKSYSTVLLYWTALEWAIEQGFALVDLGRCTPGAGTYEFKRQWNADAVPLHWYYWLAPGVAIPNLRPDNQKYRMAISLWKRLPLGLTLKLGPRIVRSIP